MKIDFLAAFLGCVLVLLAGVIPALLIAVYQTVFPPKKQGTDNEKRMNILVHRVLNTRVLRSSCPDSENGLFRVHLPEWEWNEISMLANQIMKDEGSGKRS